MTEHEHAQKLMLEPIKERAGVLAQCARGTFQLKIKENFDALIKEVERLQSITDHLCPVFVDGKFSHWVDDREPAHRAKFEAARKRSVEKYDEAFANMEDQ